MGSFWGKVVNDVEGVKIQLIKGQIINILYQAIENKTASNKNILLEKTRTCAGPALWEEMVNDTMLMSKSGLSDCFKVIFKELSNDVVKPCHMIAFYALLIDVTSRLVQNNHSVSILEELGKFHDDICLSLDHKVLTQTLLMITHWS